MPGAALSKVPLSAKVLVIALGAALPRVTEGKTKAPPSVSIDALRLDGDVAVAPVTTGGTATLTLDPVLERAAIRLLERAHPKSGALVAVDPRTGRILAWAGVRGATPAHAVVRAAMAPAASVFKLVTTTALLERYVDPDRNVCTRGGTSVIAREHLAPPSGDGAVCGPFKEALGRSRNAAFAQLATRFLTPAGLRKTADRLGFNAEAPFDVPAGVGTLEVPEDDLGFARAAAGFVGSQLSPLGAAQLGTTIATGGKVLSLRIVSEAEGYVAPRRAKVVGRAMSEGAARALGRMMEVTVHSGTSRGVFNDAEGRNVLGDIRAAGKTGTLQGSADEPLTSWFVGFAPSRAPRIVVSVLLENGHSYREKANEVARDFLRTYFAGRGARGVTSPEAVLQGAPVRSALR